MIITRCALVTASLLLFPFVTSTAQVVEPLADPIPTKIAKGSIVVGVVGFLQLPRTQDVNSEGAHQAFARLQSYLPVRAGSGRPVVHVTSGWV